MLQKSILKHKNYAPVGFSEIVMLIPALDHRNFSHRHIIANITYLRYKHWDLFNWQEERSLKTQVFSSWSCWIIESELEGMGKGRPFLCSCFYKKCKWVDGTGLCISWGYTSLFSSRENSDVLVTVPWLRGGPEVRLLGLESRPWHLPYQGPEAKHLYSLLLCFLLQKK